jgi:hypothetical protein
MSEFVKAKGISKNRVRYTDSSGRVFIYSKGTWAWRNNNPGNIRKPGKDTKLEGIIGYAGGFSVFSSYETGFKALQTLLKKDFYQNLSLFEAVKKYAPPKDKNDIKNYSKILVQVTKISLDTILKTLSEAQFLLLCLAVQRVEGFQSGEVTEELPKKKILDVKKNKQNLIIQYLIDGYGWLRKTEAVNLVEKDIVDAVIVKRQNGYIFLRSKPDKTKTNNLDP